MGDQVTGRTGSSVQSQITFFYYRDIEPAERFYRDVLGFELVEDQRWAKIYRAAGNGFVGIVSGERGFHQPRKANAVLLTLVVEDVARWYTHLKESGANLLTEVKEMEEIRVRGFFLKDPGGYTIEIQQFLDPAVARRFE